MISNGTITEEQALNCSDYKDFIKREYDIDAKEVLNNKIKKYGERRGK